MQLDHLASNMQISVLLQERLRKLQIFECLITGQKLNVNMEGFR